jgi:hypothetical protein
LAEASRKTVDDRDGEEEFGMKKLFNASSAELQDVSGGGIRELIIGFVGGAVLDGISKAATGKNASEWVTTAIDSGRNGLAAAGARMNAYANTTRSLGTSMDCGVRTRFEREY